MRVVLSLIVAICLLVHPAGQLMAQSTNTVPRGAEPIPGYSGLYVANASRFMKSAFLVVMLTRPRNVREFLGKVKTCTATREVFIRLRGEGIRSDLIRFAQVVTVLTAGDCDVFIGGDFNFAQLDRPLDSGDDTSDTDNPETDKNAGSNDKGDDVERADRTRPDIAPETQTVQGQGRTAPVRVKVADGESGIQSVFFIYEDNNRVPMSAPQGSSNYSATIDLPRDFNERSATILATNSAGLSARAKVVLRLVPWCGPRVAVSNALVRQVQENLACVGNSPGGSDGALGPNTCKAIGGYLGGRMDRFNAGGIRWTALRDELNSACIAVQPVELDLPNEVEVDSPRTNVGVGLRQAGPTRWIRITGPGISNQTQEWGGSQLYFDLPMPPPGQKAAFQVEALGPEGRPRDAATLRLIRPSVRIDVSPSGAVNVDAQSVGFMVTIPSGASAVSRLEARRVGVASVGREFSGGSEVLTLPSPEPGGSERVTFVALDRSGRQIAEQTVTLTRPEPVVPPRLTLESAAGQVVDANEVQLNLVLENAGTVTDLVIRGAPDMIELARWPVGNGKWSNTQAMPAPGQALVFHAQAVDQGNNVLAEDSLRVERPAVRLQVRPDRRFEVDTDMITAEAHVTTGADWIESIIARGANDGSDRTAMAESALVQGRAELQIDMPDPGATRLVNILAIGRDGEDYASAQITLTRPAAKLVTLLVTSPDGFEIEASTTRLLVEVINPADTAVIVVSDSGTNQVLERGRFDGVEWLGEINTPEPGQSRALVIEAQDAAGQMLASSQITLIRPVSPGFATPPWVWIGGLILSGIGMGFFGARLRGRRQGDTAGHETHAPTPQLRVFAEPDQDPRIALVPSAPASLAIRIDEDEAPAVEIAFEENKEPAR
ncbi:hypothetical protein [uncultured Roseobacter sp.]|uniref:hypothetical protein n=1 Tax=uncultured Roseobacter sp. TaxID=114847 RepID=UPI0026117E95|nr:hypothetical protein [uncultured Roseobacter sp.]